MMKPTQDQAVAWAKEVSGVEFPAGTAGVKIGMSPEHLERFAALAYEAGRNTAPPQREWQGLTDEEKKAIYEQADIENWHDQPLLEAVEAKLKEKNT